MSGRKDLLLAGAALVVVIAVLALGFHSLGGRANQRDFKADERRIADLQALARQIRLHPHELPDTLAAVGPTSDLNDPVSKLPYEYHRKSGVAYELCAKFATDSGEEGGYSIGSGFWTHPKGRHCYQMDTAQNNLY